MKADLIKALHIISSNSAAATLKVVLRMPDHRVLIGEDLLAYGPVPAGNELIHWRLIREEFIGSIYLDCPEFSMDHYADNGWLGNDSRLAKEKPIIVWVSPKLGEQLLLAWMTVLFDHLKLDLSQLLIAQIEHLHPNQPARGITEISREDVKQALPEARPLSQQEIDEYQRAWKTYTSNDPVDLMRFLSRQSDNTPLFAAMKQLVYRYPSVETGLCVFDEDLLQNTQKHGPEAERIIAYTMGDKDGLDSPGENYLFYRLRKLGHPHRSRPLVTVNGNCRTINSCQAVLTAYGLQILEGRSDALEMDDIDDWIGGVHLDKTMNIPFRINDDLYLSM